jgi:hypothetical protein
MLVYGVRYVVLSRQYRDLNMIGHQSAAIKTYPANESLHVSPA